MPLIKYLLLFNVLLLPLAAAPDLAATSNLIEHSPPALRDDDGPLFEPRHVGFGMTPATVCEAMHGKPDAMLSPEIWVYWNFRSGLVGAEKFDALVVTFVSGRVKQYRLVERKAVLALQETLRKTAPRPGALAKQ
ncbi:MAG TPA: hypothetical protein VM029_12490 [Opitutaceae bacterium]|nr:hypothetical protein [Opitutaceae bacterium]